MISRACKTVLMISYPFPPLGAAGSLRPYRFAKYLPEFSWKPIVLTIKERDDAPKDFTLLESLPQEVSIIRTSIFDPYLSYQSFRNRGLGSKKVKSENRGPTCRDKTNKKDPLPTTTKRLKRFVKSTITTPDHQVFWFPFAVIRGASLIKKYGVDLLFTTSPPHSSHLIGWALKSMFGVPWIADFRDPWTDNFGFHEGMSKRRYAFERRLEAMVIRNADRIVANTDANRKRLIDRFAEQEQSKFVTIHNGFERYPAPVRRTEFAKFTIVHTGIFYPKVRPYFFFEALSRWFETSGHDRSTVQVLLVGEHNDGTRIVVTRFGLHDVVEFVPRMPYRDTLHIAYNADLLLVSLGFDPENSGWVPIKIYDYLSTSRPVLAFLPEGEAADIIRETSAGFVIHSEDVDKTIGILDAEYKKKFFSDLGTPEFSPDAARISRFAAENLTRKLATTMEEVCL